MAMLDFGGKPFYVSATGGAPISEMVDVGLYFANMTLLLKLVSFQGASTSFQVSMETSMDPKGNDWVTLGSFATLTTVGALDRETFTGLLRYVRWNVTSLGSATQAVFMLSGVARNA